MDVCGQRVRGRAVLDGNPWRIYRKVSHGQSGGARKRRQRSPADPCRSGAQPVAALAAAVQKNAKRRCISCGRKRLRQIALLATGNERDGRATPKPFALVTASLAGLQFPLDVGNAHCRPSVLSTSNTHCRDPTRQHVRGCSSTNHNHHALATLHLTDVRFRALSPAHWLSLFLRGDGHHGLILAPVTVLKRGSPLAPCSFPFALPNDMCGV